MNGGGGGAGVDENDAATPNGSKGSKGSEKASKVKSGRIVKKKGKSKAKDDGYKLSSKTAATVTDESLGTSRPRRSRGVKREPVSRPTKKVNPAYYVGYVEEGESVEMIMKKFEVLDRLQASMTGGSTVPASAPDASSPVPTMTATAAASPAKKKRSDGSEGSDDLEVPDADEEENEDDLDADLDDEEAELERAAEAEADYANQIVIADDNLLAQLFRDTSSFSADHLAAAPEIYEYYDERDFWSSDSDGEKRKPSGDAPKTFKRIKLSSLKSSSSKSKAPSTTAPVVKAEPVADEGEVEFSEKPAKTRKGPTPEEIAQKKAAREEERRLKREQKQKEKAEAKAIRAAEREKLRIEKKAAKLAAAQESAVQRKKRREEAAAAKEKEREEKKRQKREARAARQRELEAMTRAGWRSAVGSGALALALAGRVERSTAGPEAVYTKIPPGPLPFTWGHTIAPFQRPEDLPDLNVVPIAKPVSSVLDLDWSSIPGMKMGTVQGILMDPPWACEVGAAAKEASVTAEDLAKFKIPHEVMPAGLVFIWTPKHLTSAVLDAFRDQGFIYVENYTWLRKHPNNRFVEDGPSGSESPFLATKRTLLVLRRVGPDGHLCPLKHQRNADVSFEFVVSEKDAWQRPIQPDFVYRLIETMLYTVSDKTFGELGLVELWAMPKTPLRPAWAAVCDERQIIQPAVVQESSNPTTTTTTATTTTEAATNKATPSKGKKKKRSARALSMSPGNQRSSPRSKRART